MTTIISTIAIYLIALIIIGIIEQNVSHTQTATETTQTWRRSKYSREFKYYDEPKQYARKSRVLDLKTGPSTAKIETTVGARIPHYESTVTPRYKYTTTSSPSPTTSAGSTPTFTKITTINAPNTGSVSGMSTGRLKFTPIIVQSSSTSTTPRLISNKNTSKKPSVTTQKTVAAKPTYKLTSSSIQEVTTLKPTSVVMNDSSTPSTSTTHETSRIHTYYHQKLKEKPKVKIQTNISQNLVPLPAGAGAALVKPTKYHYYPHNQHIYLLPECAIQQVCNAVYVRLNYTQPLCACPSRYRDPCSASLNSDDLHTTELITDPNGRRALTLVKTCEPTSEMRQCRAPRDWSLLALQNVRTGKSHYLVICRCPENSILEGPISHDQPTYASVPGIRVYGMMCVQLIGFNRKRDARPLRFARSIRPPFPTRHLSHLISNATWD